jgi:2-C-methyl-D-erythritol 4-phosphate cytidylyltransferase
MKTYAVIVAGGSGQRMGSSLPKQFLPLCGKPILWHTLNTFFLAINDIRIILVLPLSHLPYGQELRDSFEKSSQISVVEGGSSRYDSVKSGLSLIREQSGLSLIREQSIVFVHDGVRCLLTPDLIQRCYETALTKGNATPAVASKDSVRIVTDSGNMVADRNNVQLIQTPQAFMSDIILKAFEQPYQERFTDEATVVESSGTAIILVPGEHENIKITNPIDLLIAEKVLESRL